MSRLVAPTASAHEQLERFYDEHEGFDLLDADLTTGNGMPDGLLATLAHHQRLLRVASGDVTDAQLLLDAGLSSASDVAELSVDALVERLTAAAPDSNGATRARAARLHRSAVDIRERTGLLASALRDAAGTHYHQSRFANAQADLLALAAATPEAASAPPSDNPDAFSPNAYLVKLREHVTNTIAPKNHLRGRRPDIFDLDPLDRAEADAEVPYLRLVNELLEHGLVHAVPGVDPYEYLATAEFPFGLPFHRPLAELRAYLGYLGVGLATIFARLEAPGPVVSRERLRLSYEQALLATAPPADAERLRKLWGMRDGEELPGALRVAGLFCARAGLDDDQLTALLYQDLTAEGNDELRKRFFVNRTPTGQAGSPAPLDLVPGEGGASLAHLTNTRLDHVQRLLRLSDRLGWEPNDLDWALRSLSPAKTAIQEATLDSLAAVEWLRTRFEEPVEVVCSLFHDMRTTGRQRRDAPAALFDRVFNQPVGFDRRSSAAYHPAYPLNPTYAGTAIVWNVRGTEDRDAQVRARLLAGLSVGSDDLTALVRRLHGDVETLALDVPTLSRLYRVSKLASLLGHSLPDLFELLDRIGLPDWAKPGQPATPQQVVRITEWSDGLRDASISIPRLRYLLSGHHDPTVDVGYAPGDVLSCVEGLPGRDGAQVVTAGGLIGNLIDADLAKQIVARLAEAGVLDEAGAVRMPPSRLTYRWLADLLEGLLAAPPIPTLQFGPEMWVDCTDLAGHHPTDALTVEVWVRGDPPNEASEMLVYKGGHGEFPGHGLLWLHSSYVSVHFGDPTRQAVEAMPKDAWTHVAYAWDRTSQLLRLYVDGTERHAVQQEPPNLRASSQPLTLSTSHAQRFTGRMHELRVWAVARSAQQIEADMHRRLSGAEPGLVGYWRVDDGGSSIVDRAPAQNHGSIEGTGGAWTTEGPPPLDQRIVAVLDALQAARASLDAHENAVLAALAAFLDAPVPQIDAALEFAGLIIGVDPLSALLGPLGSATEVARSGRSTRERRIGRLQELFAATAYALAAMRTVQLSPEELEALPAITAAFGIGPIVPGFRFALDELLALHRYRQLADGWAKLDAGLLEVLCAEPAARAGMLATATGWEPSELGAAMAALGIDGDGLGRVAELRRLHQLWEACSRTGLDVAAVARIAALHGAAGQQWSAYVDGAATALEAANATVDDAAWRELDDPIHDDLNERSRDALGAHLGHLRGFDDQRLEHLYKSLYIDVEMGGCARISRLKQALNSLQLYVHRVQAGLEPGARITTPRDVWDEQWDKLREYRIWEAHRRLDAYPESFLDPSLRALKTIAYEAVETDLLKSDLSDETARTSYRRYLETFAGHANLQPVSAAYAAIVEPGKSEPTDTIVVVGRTRSTAPAYFLRRASIANHEGKLMVTEWFPWEPVEIGGAIQGAVVTPAYAFDKLHLVWVAQRTEDHTRMVGGASKKTKGTFASVQYAVQDSNGHWSTPRMLAEDVLIKVTTDEKEPEERGGPPPPGWDKHVIKVFPDFRMWMLEVDETDQCWAEAYPLRMTGPEELVVLYGRYPEIQPAVLGGDGSVRRIDFEIGGTKCIRRPGIDQTKGTRLVTRYNTMVPALLLNYHQVGDEHREELLLGSIDPNATSRPVTGLLGCALVDNHDEAFLVLPRDPTGAEVDLATLQVMAEVTVEERTATALHLDEPRRTEPRGYLHHTFERLSTATTTPLMRRLAGGGITGLLAPASQTLRELPFSRLAPATGALPARGEVMDFAGPFGRYYWEIFFYLPFLVAKALNAAKRFEEAHAWYGYIFDPHAAPADGGDATYLCKLDGDMSNDGSGQPLVSDPNAAPPPPDGRLSWVAERLRGGPARQVLRLQRLIVNDQTPQVWIREPWQAGSDGFTISFWLRSDFRVRDHVLIDPDGGLPLFIDSDPATQSIVFGTSPTPEQPGLSMRGIVGGKFQVLTLSYARSEQRYVAHLDGVPQHLTGSAKPPDIDAIKQLWLFPAVRDSGGYLIADLKVWPRPVPLHELDEALASQDRPWRTRALRGHSLGRIISRLADPSYLAALGRHRDAADVNAQTRPAACQKAIVMRYIDNLIDWGDELFRADSWESNIRATMLYVQAGDLLEQTDSLVSADAVSSVPLEQYVRPSGASQLLTDTTFAAPGSDFPTPENPELLGYWDLVADRLHKLRRCMNIEGETRSLALYQPPIDPHQLVARAAAGARLGALPVSAQAPTLPFPRVIEHAKETAFRVTRLGRELLRALESQDSTDVFMMDLEHEREMLDRTTDLKDNEIAEQAANLQALHQGRARILAQGAYSTTLLAGGDGLHLDVSSVQMSVGAVALNLMAGGFHTTAVPLYLPPKIAGTAAGGVQPAEAVEAAASALGALASVADTIAGMLAYSADVWRRKADQTADVAFNAIELSQIDQEIAAAELRLAHLKLEQQIHERSIEQIRAKEVMIANQFTGPTLYRWMVQRASAAYSRAYQVAYELALRAQASYQHAHSTDKTFIQASHWDGLQKGLLAGEALLADLERLHLAGIEPVTGATVGAQIPLSPLAVAALRERGACEFELSERDLARQYPGRYRRRFASVSLALQGDLGRAGSVHATLEQLDHCILVEPSVDGERLLLREPGETTDTSALRWSHVAGPPATVSGVTASDRRLELHFDQDGRSPFAGTGAVSRWRLRMPRASNLDLDYGAITGATMHVRYTAEDGGADFTRSVLETAALRRHVGCRGLSLRTLFPEQWQALVAGPAGQVDVEISELMLARNLKPGTMQLGWADGDGPRSLALLPAGSTDEFGIEVNGAPWDPATGIAPAPAGNGSASRSWPLGLRITGAADGLEDILLLVPFEGELDWSGAV